MTGRRLAIVTAVLNGGIATLALLHYTHVAIVVNHGTQPTIPYEFKLASKPSAHCTVPSVPVDGWKTCFFLGRLQNDDTILARFGRVPDPAEDPPDWDGWDATGYFMDLDPVAEVTVAVGPKNVPVGRHLLHAISFRRDP